MSSKFGYLNSDFEKQYASNTVISNHLYGSPNLLLSMINHFEYKLEHNLLWNDKNSMRFSLELREPFLDYRLVERTLATNTDLIINEGYTKAILREAMKGVLPQDIRLRKDKIGFSTPEHKWLRDSRFLQLIQSIIQSETFKTRGVFDQKKVQNLYNRYVRGESKLAREIWKVINTELWLRKFID